MKVLDRFHETFWVVIASFWLFGHLIKAIVLLPVTILRQKVNAHLNTTTRQRRVQR